MSSRLTLLRSALLCATVLAGVGAVSTSARADLDDGTLDNTGVFPLPSGQFITPMAATGTKLFPLNPGLTSAPNFVANGAISSALSLDGKTLLVLTSGYNDADAVAGGSSSSSQFIFVYDVSGAYKTTPNLTQVVTIPDAFLGLAWTPDGTKFVVSGGSTDRVAVYTKGGSGWAQSQSVSLGHGSYATGPFAVFAGFLGNGIGFAFGSNAAGLDVSSDGRYVYVANIGNDSLSIVDLQAGAVVSETNLRPYNLGGTPGTAGGETPYTVKLSADGKTAYVSSLRDREIVALNVTVPASPTFVARIATTGNPNSMIVRGTKLYVTQDNSDLVSIVDTTTNTVTANISTVAPAGTLANTSYTGAAPNGLAISPDGNYLYITNGGANSVAVIALTGANANTVLTVIPTAYYPASVAVSSDGSELYVTNAKSDPGKNPLYGKAGNQYILQLTSSSLAAIPVPAPTDYTNLTNQVAANNGYAATANPADAATMAFLNAHIQHVIYIVKENRTFDQVLGDLGNGSNGNPALTQFGKRVTPNFHALSRNFVTLDNFFCSGEVSGNGWAWSTSARESDFGVKSIPPNYAGRNFNNNSEGANRNVNVALPTTTLRNTAYQGLYNQLASAFPGGPANLLPGTNNDFGIDGPSGLKQAGTIWDAALRKGLTVRSYGFFIDGVPYNIPASIGGLDPIQRPDLGYYRSPALLNPPVTVAVSTSPSLLAYTDPYFRGFDNAFPDVWRVEEWQREFATQTAANGTMPNLTLLRVMHDHMGNFSGSDMAVAGLTTPETQQADNDAAVGRIVDTVAHSRYASSTLIFVLEDDAQDGPDHMDAHRSTAYVVGPYVRKNAVVSTRYTTVNMVRTIEDILGLDHLTLNDAYQRPMSDVFDITSNGAWTYTATLSPYLASTTIALAPLNGESTVRYADNDPAVPTHDAAYWAEVTRGFDFTAADRVPADLFNEVLWEGLKPGIAYPTVRSGEDLRTRNVSEGAVAAPVVR